jgi:hypothetical protein
MLHDAPVNVKTSRVGVSAVSIDRQADGEAGAGDSAVGVRAVLGLDRPAMGFDDLFRDRQAQPGMGPELLASRRSV